MKTLSIKAWIGLGVAAVLAFFVWSSYNGLVRSAIAVDNQWSQVEVQYQRRLDLIPNLVSTVKGITKQELDVFGEIANARQGYAGAKTSEARVEAANQVESALGRLLVITENYPQLRSSDSFNNLMVELTGTENRISVERMRFNDAVSSFNGQIRTFPSNIVARLFGFEERTLFEAKDGAEEAPSVNFQ